jgi:hypothetical protein
MNWQRDLRVRTQKASAVPPPGTIGETGWDILLALHSDPASKLTVEKLGAIASVQPLVLGEWLLWLEDRRLVAGARDRRTGEIRAVLTSGGRELLDRYLSATADLRKKTLH